MKEDTKTVERNVEKTQKKKKCEKREADRRKIVVNKTNGSHYGELHRN